MKKRKEKWVPSITLKVWYILILEFRKERDSKRGKLLLSCFSKRFFSAVKNTDQSREISLGSALSRGKKCPTEFWEIIIVLFWGLVFITTFIIVSCQNLMSSSDLLTHWICKCYIWSQNLPSYVTYWSLISIFISKSLNQFFFKKNFTNFWYCDVFYGICLSLIYFGSFKASIFLLKWLKKCFWGFFLLIFQRSYVN